MFAAEEADGSGVDGDGVWEVPPQKDLSPHRSLPDVRKSVRKKLGAVGSKKSRDTDSHPLSLRGSTDSDDIAGEISAALATGAPTPTPSVTPHPSSWNPLNKSRSMQN
jgi:hypothetical protein